MAASIAPTLPVASSLKALERVISQLVAEYNINEEYLRHGTGEMFVSHRADIVAVLAQKLLLSEREQQLLLTYSTFPIEKRKMILDFAQDFFQKLQEHDHT